MKKIDLSSFGLDKNQGEAYLAMINSGPASILEISKRSGINRSMLYEIIDSLIEQGLVYKSVRKKKIKFVARKPEVILDLLAKKVTQFEELLPMLKSLSTNGTFLPIISFHEGINGIKQAYLAAIHSKENRLFAFVGVESLLSRSLELEKFWDEEFKKERKKHNVFGRLIVPNNAAGRKFQSKDNQNFRESRLIDADAFNFPAEVLLFDDFSTFISYTQHEEFAIQIKSKSITDTLKMVWWFTWNHIDTSA